MCCLASSQKACKQDMCLMTVCVCEREKERKRVIMKVCGPEINLEAGRAPINWTMFWSYKYLWFPKGFQIVITDFWKGFSGFCPHWSGVIGSNHHSAIFTTTQAYLPPLTVCKKCWNATFNAIQQYFWVKCNHHWGYPEQNPGFCLRLL